MIKFLTQFFSKSQFKIRRYSTYSDYVKHQKEKTTDPVRREKWLNEEWEEKLSFFENKFKKYKSKYFKDSFITAVGLGARTGQEVQAFINLGYEAIGLDLVECSPLVIKGDIHKMPFENERFDIAFTNIFDHSLYPEKFASEIGRILKIDGIAILHLAVGNETDPFGVLEINDPKAFVTFIITAINQYLKKIS
jgi:SAM-dependent methyltransferase